MARPDFLSCCFNSFSINNFFRPDGRKKAYVRLTSDYEALDFANKVSYKLVPTSVDL